MSQQKCPCDKKKIHISAPLSSKHDCSALFSASGGIDEIMSLESFIHTFIWSC